MKLITLVIIQLLSFRLSGIFLSDLVDHSSKFPVKEQKQFIDLFDTLDGWARHEITTAATIVIRPNQAYELEDGTKPYEDVRVRKALQMAVRNDVLLELGQAGRGITAENHHVGPAHPDYVDIGETPFDPAGSSTYLIES